MAASSAGGAGRAAADDAAKDGGLKEYAGERVATRDAGETRRDRAGDMAEHVKLSRMSEADDVEAYLTTFERVMQLGRVSEDLWTLKFAPQLIGKA